MTKKPPRMMRGGFFAGICAAGALKAAAFACGRAPGLYDMNDLLG